MVLKIKVAATRLGLEYVNLVSFLLILFKYDNQDMTLKDPFFSVAMSSKYSCIATGLKLFNM